MSLPVVRDLGYVLRALFARPAFSVAAALTLALGIGANTAIFSVIKAVVLDPLPYVQPEQLVSVGQANSMAERDAVNVGYATFVDFQKLDGIASSAVFADWQASVAAEGDAQMVTGMRVSPQFFDVLGAAPLLGRSFTVEEDQSGLHDVVVLSAGLWQRQLGADPNVIGRKLIVNGRARTIVGVMPPSFQPMFYGNVAGHPQIWLPLGYRLSDPFACRDCLHLQAIARLRPEASVATLQAAFDALAPRLIQDFPQKYPAATHFVVAPLQQALVGSAPAMLWLLLAASGLVLLIACVDVGNLMLARAQARERELAVRCALGAGRARLVELLLAESLLLAAIGGIAGCGLALLGTRALVGFAATAVPRMESAALDGRMLLFAALLSLAVAVATGLWPALRASRLQVDETLRSGTRSSGGKRSMLAQQTLIVAQVALAFVLAIGATLVLRSFAGLVRVDPGFEPAGLVAMNITTVGPRYDKPEPVNAFYAQLLERVGAAPGVQAVAEVSPLPMSGNYDRAGFHVRDRAIAAQEAPEVDRVIASADYFRTLRIPLLRGRYFSADDRAGGTPVALVSATLAQSLFRGEEVLGRQIQLGGRDDKAPWATIVGVVGDVRQYGLDHATTPQAYLAQSQQPADPTALVVRSSLPPDAVAALVRSATRSLDAAIPVYDVAPLEQRISDSLARRRVTLALFGLFALTALTLAGIGIYGVVSFAVAQHTPALGLRRALGASDARVLQWVLRRSGRFAVLGMAIGIPVALLWGRLLAGELVGISQYDPWSFAAVCVALAMIVVAASLGPALRALRVAPTTALRYD